MLGSISRLLVTTLTAVTSLLGPATAGPLPPAPVPVEKPIVGWVDVTYVPGAGIKVIPGGDIAAGFTCTPTRTASGTVVECAKNADVDVVYKCSAIDLDTVGFFAVVTVPPLQADGLCWDDSEGRLAHLDTTVSHHTHVDFPTLLTNRVVCAVAYGESVKTAWDIRCSYTFSIRQPVVGGVTMTQATQTGAIQWSTWGVLSTPDWSCVLVTPALAAGAPYVDCNTTPANQIQWYCNVGFVTAAVSPTLPNSPLPQVRAQGSCDSNTTTAAAPHVSTPSFSTYDVPMVSGVPSDQYATAPLNYDTSRFVCQAWGPLNTYVPIAPWQIECGEP